MRLTRLRKVDGGPGYRPMGSGSAVPKAEAGDGGPEGIGAVDRSCVCRFMYLGMPMSLTRYSCRAQTLVDLHKEGGTRHQIEETLAAMPFVSGSYP